MGSQRKSKTAIADDVKTLLDAMRRIERSRRTAAREDEKRAGLSGAQLFVLRELVRRDARSLGDLAARTSTDASSVSVVVDRLVQKGLVVRKSAPADARRMEIRLSARGRSIVRSSANHAELRIDEALASLGSTKRRALVSDLERVANALSVEQETMPD